MHYKFKRPWDYGKLEPIAKRVYARPASREWDGRFHRFVENAPRYNLNWRNDK